MSIFDRFYRFLDSTFGIYPPARSVGVVVPPANETQQQTTKTQSETFVTAS